ncbi:unnamed protein product [Closterium sp. NIES-53]
MGAFPHARLQLLAACKATAATSRETITKCSANAAAAARSPFVAAASSRPIAPPFRRHVAPLLRLCRPPVWPPCASAPVPPLHACGGGSYKGDEGGKGVAGRRQQPPASAPTKFVGNLDSAILLPALPSAMHCNGRDLGRGVAGLAAEAVGEKGCGDGGFDKAAPAAPPPSTFRCTYPPLSSPPAASSSILSLSRPSSPFAPPAASAVVGRGWRGMAVVKPAAPVASGPLLQSPVGQLL